MSRTSDRPDGGKPRRALARIVAAAFSVAMLTTIAVPASAATARSAATDSPAVAAAATAHYSPVIPDGYRWVFVGYFSTSAKCYAWGDYYLTANYIPFHCYLTQRYDLPIWELDEEIITP